jgi:hypothetical protein
MDEFSWDTAWKWNCFSSAASIGDAAVVVVEDSEVGGEEVKVCRDAKGDKETALLCLELSPAETCDVSPIVGWTTSLVGADAADAAAAAAAADDEEEDEEEACRDEVSTAASFTRLVRGEEGGALVLIT